MQFAGPDSLNVTWYREDPFTEIRRLYHVWKRRLGAYSNNPAVDDSADMITLCYSES
jgi:hypothetical protein